MIKNKKRQLKSLDPKQLAMVTAGGATGPSSFDCSGLTQAVPTQDIRTYGPIMN
jgi:hypothetical protein